MNLSLFFNWAPPGWFLYFFLNCMEGQRRKRRYGVHGGAQSTEEQIYAELRQVQLLTRCTTQTLNVMLQRLHPFFKGCEGVKKLQMPRVRARKLSRFKKQLHGCVGADCLYVFGPENKEVHCPKCGESRYSSDGKPKEVSRSLFRSPIYKPLPYYYHITYMYIAPMYVYNIHIIYVALTIN